MIELELKKEFLLLSSYKNKLPPVNIDVVYVFSGVEKNRLIGSSFNRLKTGVKIWEKLSKIQKQPPIFLFQGSSEWYLPVKQAFDNNRFNIPKPFLRLELVKTWVNTLDQFLQIPAGLKKLKNWLIVTSPWHIPRVKRYARKHWPNKLVYYWSSSVKPKEFVKYFPLEIKKIIAYAKKGDLSKEL